MAPKSLREESNFTLVNTVESLYMDLIDKLNIENAEARKSAFKSIAAACHAMRKYRNNLLHSAFIELKASGEVMGILRSNPKLKIQPDSGDTVRSRDPD